MGGDSADWTLVNYEQHAVNFINLNEDCFNGLYPGAAPVIEADREAEIVVYGGSSSNLPIRRDRHIEAIACVPRAEDSGKKLQHVTWRWAASQQLPFFTHMARIEPGLESGLKELAESVMIITMVYVKIEPVRTSGASSQCARADCSAQAMSLSNGIS